MPRKAVKSIKKSDLDKGRRYTYGNDEDNKVSLYKENGFYHVEGFKEGEYFTYFYPKFTDAKKDYD